MRHLRDINEGSEDIKMKKFVMTTISDSSDHYIYFIEHHKLPTKKELERFLIENGSDVDKKANHSYENIDMCVEIKGFKKIPN